MEELEPTLLESPLIKAARNEDEKEVERLLQKGEPINEGDRYGWTALHKASYTGNVKILEKLLQAGAAVDQEANDGWTTLPLASLCDNTLIVKRLLRAGANPIRFFQSFPDYHPTYALEREKYLSEKRENQWQKKRLLLIAYNKENPNKNPLASLPAEMLEYIWKYGLQTLSKQEWDEWQQFKEDNPEIKKLAYQKNITVACKQPYLGINYVFLF